MTLEERRIIRVFPRRTRATPDDELVFVGYPPLWRPEADEVHVSVTFTWDITEGRRMAQAWAPYYPHVKIAGPALNTPASNFEPGMYLKKGHVITTRGCPNGCGFCFVPKREGSLRCLPIRDGWLVDDNNLLAAPRGHIERVLDMLARQPHRAEFVGGLDVFRLEEWFVQAITAIRFKRVYLAYDRAIQRKALAQAVRLLRWYGHSHHKVSAYVLIGYPGDSVEKAESRLQFVKDCGAVPYPMWFRGEEQRPKPREWADLQAKLITRIGR